MSIEAPPSPPQALNVALQQANNAAKRLVFPVLCEAIVGLTPPETVG
jgi:hypothetical protein